jgi:hypothetical protein
MSKTGGFVHKTKGTVLCVHCGDQARGYLSIQEEYIGNLSCSKCNRTLSNALKEGPMPEATEEPKPKSKPKKKASATVTSEPAEEPKDVDGVEVFTPDPPKKRGLFGRKRGNS